jgi:monothiol glutaredoxin
MADSLEQEVAKEIKEHKILIYGKGTKMQPQCGFTNETIQFFQKYGHPFEVVNVLGNNEKREYLSKLTNWPTLPKVFINGTFYGDTDILDEMERKGEVKPLLDSAFNPQKTG